MNREYIEQLQNNLKWRVDRLMAVDYRLFHGTVRQFCGFLKANDVFAGVLEELQRRFPAAGVDVQKVTQGGECVELRFALTNQTHSTPFVINNNKTVYFLTIDICDYQKPASKRGVLQTMEITQDDLIRETGRG